MHAVGHLVSVGRKNQPDVPYTKINALGIDTAPSRCKTFGAYILRMLISCAHLNWIFFG